jgi:predicted enzyme related to lactoylglutathione lyase
MLNDSKVTANVPVSDIDRARGFYADMLGLTPAGENPGGLIYTTAGGTTFFLYQTEYAGQAGHTIAQWHVSSVDDEVRELKAKGLEFEHYDMPGVTWEGDVATLEGMGRAAWFKDSEGNIMALIQAIRGDA